jgi:hypothetical protein
MNRNENPTRQRPTAAFVVALLAATLMLLSGRILSLTNHMADQTGDQGINWLWGSPVFSGRPVLWLVVGLFSACIVLVGAFVIYLRPGTSRTVGVVIAVASVFAVIAGAGGALAGILGIGAGILAVIWKPQPAE